MIDAIWWTAVGVSLGVAGTVAWVQYELARDLREVAGNDMQNVVGGLLGGGPRE